jgi:dTDP-4-dehydrorhamnose reductase
MITLIGHGYLGGYIQRELENQNLKYFWITHTDRLPDKTTTIINAAGFTGRPNVDVCETLKQDTIEGNVIFPLELEQRAGSVPVVHVTSGCVYDGYPPGGWSEQDVPNFNFDNGSFYSGTKALAQYFLAPYLTKSYLLRIRLPFAGEPDPKNLLTKLCQYPKLLDVKNSLSDVTDVARVAVHFAQRLPNPGIYNVTNPGAKTTREIADMLGLNKQWFAPGEFATAVKAPRSNCILNTDKLSRVFPIPDIDTALHRAVNQFLNSSRI